MTLPLAPQRAFSEPLYYLCGSDEDGCFDGYEVYCACIPVSSLQANQLYCLDFDNMTCQLLSERPDCNAALIFKNQVSCIATIFQSEPYPPCKVATQSFCYLNAIFICHENGDPASCKK